MNAVETTRGRIAARKVGVVAAGHTSVVMAMAGVRMPLESYPLQALVSEPVKPVLPCVVMSNTIHAYISQSDKGELVIGAGTDAYVSYSQAGGLHIAEHTLEAICELFPTFRRLRMLRNWGGIVDVTPDRSPIIGLTPVPGLLCELRLGHRRIQGDAGVGPCLRRDDRARRAASDRRAVLARSLPHRPADRRGRRRGGGALMLLIACPWCGARPENEFRYGGEAHIARPRDPASVGRCGVGGLPVHAQQSEGRARRALAAHAWLRPVLQLRARHGDRPHPSRPTGLARHRRDDARHSARPTAAASTAHAADRSASTAGDYVAAPGDTLASALLANGVHLVGRSFKYHRPRGILSAGSEEPNALVTIDRGAGRVTPNLRATQVELYDGLRARQPEPLPVAGASISVRSQRVRAAAVRGILLQDLHVAARVLAACL